MRNSILVRSIAAVSGIVMLASVAACGDNTASNTDSSASTDTKTTEAVSGNFSGAGASSQQAAVEAWIAGFQGATRMPRSLTTRLVPALAFPPS